jgi:hypothetical protein
MKIISRKENLKKGFFGRYKEHENTMTLGENGGFIKSLHMVSAYKPMPFESAQPKYWFAFGMDDRRVLLELDHDEVMELKNQLEEKIVKGLRRVK